MGAGEGELRAWLKLVLVRSERGLESIFVYITIEMLSLSLPLAGHYCNNAGSHYCMVRVEARRFRGGAAGPSQVSPSPHSSRELSALIVTTYGYSVDSRVLSRQATSPTERFYSFRNFSLDVADRMTSGLCITTCQKLILCPLLVYPAVSLQCNDSYLNHLHLYPSASFHQFVRVMVIHYLSYSH